MAESVAIPTPLSRVRRTGRLLGIATIYELRKQSAFRAGFVVREIIGGLERQGLMVLVFAALYRSLRAPTIRGYTFHDMVGYLVLMAIVEKVVFHDPRSLDLSEQIFEGYITKYVVMPVRYRTLALARWLQYTGLHLALAMVLWAAGRLLLPAWWPRLAGAVPVLEALVLALLGSYCLFLLYFTVHALAFWLHVVWSLLGCVRMAAMFLMGQVLPLSLMPHDAERVMAWTFPYWTAFAPVVIATGRPGAPSFGRGLVVLAAWTVALQALAAFTWRRGLRRYGGVGM